MSLLKTIFRLWKGKIITGIGFIILINTIIFGSSLVIGKGVVNYTMVEGTGYFIYDTNTELPYCISSEYGYLEGKEVFFIGLRSNCGFFHGTGVIIIFINEVDSFDSQIIQWILKIIPYILLSSLILIITYFIIKKMKNKQKY